MLVQLHQAPTIPRALVWPKEAAVAVVGPEACVLQRCRGGAHVAMKGTDTVEINENVHATRSRYTLMTKCIARWVGFVRAAFRLEIHLFTLSDG